MVNKKDIELIDEYEELLVLLRQLHEDTPILEMQHRSIKQAFVSAQEKLEETISLADEQICKNKEIIIGEFEKECRKILDALLSETQAQATKTLKKIQTEKKSLEELLVKSENMKKELEIELDEKIKQKPQAAKKTNLLKDGTICSGNHISKEYSNHINKDLFVKRVGRKNEKPWNNDFCMFVTEISEDKIYGDRYKDGKLYDEHVGYDLNDFFMIYKGPCETKILKSRK